MQYTIFKPFKLQGKGGNNFMVRKSIDQAKLRVIQTE